MAIMLMRLSVLRSVFFVSLYSSWHVCPVLTFLLLPRQEPEARRPPHHQLNQRYHSVCDNNNNINKDSSLIVRRATSNNKNSVVDVTTVEKRQAPTSLLEKSGGILYRTSTFDQRELSLIKQDLGSYEHHLVEETSSSVAQHRLGAVLTQTQQQQKQSQQQSLPYESTIPILRQGSLVDWIRTVTNNPNYVLRDDKVPVEIRSYEKRGAGMTWHSDDVLFDPPQLEVVWTLENSSDCVTMWKNDNLQQSAIETDPNGTLLIVAGGPEHCVTSLKYGKRVIVKCVFALKDAVFLEDNLDKNQFGKGSSLKKSQKKTKKTKQPKKR